MELIFFSWIQRKKAWKCFPAKVLQNQEQVILNDVYREQFLSFWWSSGGRAPNGVDNKASVSKLTQVKIGATNPSLDLPWKIRTLRQQA